MCLFITKEQEKPLIAEEDIITYKVMYKKRYLLGLIWFWKSYVKEYVWYTKSPKRIMIHLEEFEHHIHKFVIEKAYYSFDSIKTLKQWYHVVEDSKYLFIVKCIISKGTIYYDTDGQIASERIKLIGRVK